ncbi:hypothetical protein NHQ30_001398 [Ciborinia camelliae]|nr:hypothetical protein NHQ30_001398 [Ciborinia camelliae]
MSYFLNSLPPSENMPGTLGLESPPQHDVPHLSGAKSNIYMPPSTPTASATSSLYLLDTRSTTSIDMLGGGGTIVGRKRMRDSLPYEYAYERGNQFDDGDSNLIAPGSPMPFVNTKYQLAGGLDTPQANLQNRDLGRESDYGDIKYRRELSDVKETLEVEGEGEGEGQLYRDENGRARVRGHAKVNQKSWIKPALEAVGGMVGKVWEFCANIPFRGFQAGGGTGYIFGSATPIQPVPVDETRDKMWENEKSHATPVPSGFQMGGMVENYMDQHYVAPQEDTTQPRPAKRRQTSFTAQSGPDDMSRNWVVVPPPQPPKPDYPLMQQYPTVPADAFTIPQSQAQRSRLSQQRSGIARCSVPTASISGRRHLVSPQFTSSNMGAPRRPTYQTTYSTPCRESISHIPSPGGSRIPRWTPNSPKTGPTVIANDSPAAREAAAWKAKQLKEEREQDEMMRKFDRQMKDLIRQGQEALGTTIADMDIDDEDVFVGGL